MAKQKPSKHHRKPKLRDMNPFAGQSGRRPWIDLKPRPKQKTIAGLKEVILHPERVKRKPTFKPEPPVRPKPPPKRKPSVPEVAIQASVKTFNRFLRGR